MRRVWMLPALLTLVLALAGCGDKTYNTTTVNISGPFEQCSVIILPSGRQVSFGEGGVSVRDGNTIAVNGVTYTVDFSSCAAVTSTAPPTGGGA